jgi:hypothetical protein
MMSNTTNSRYRAYSITTRCTEVGPPSDRWGRRFEASFTVDPDAPDESSWQSFPNSAFDSCAKASANALTAAKRSIDMDPFDAQCVGPPFT